MSDLPAGWTLVPYKDLGDWYGGGTPSKSNPAYWTDGTIPWLSPKDMGEDTIGATQDAIHPSAVVETSVRVVPAGSVAVVVRSGILERILPVAYVPFETTLNQDMKALVPRVGILPKWVAWALRARGNDLLRLTRKSGTTVASIEMPRFMQQQMPIPPLDEQQRIVAILEDHLSHLAHGRNAIKAFAPKASQFTRSMLLNLVLGGGSGQADHLGVRLAGRSLDSAVADTDWGGVEEPHIPLPSDWRWLKWHNVGSSQNGKAVPSADYTDDGLRLLRPGNLEADGTLSWTDKNTKYLPDNYRESHAGLLLAEGDIVMNLTAQSLRDDFLGRVCLVREGDEALLNQRLARLVSHRCEPEYALLVLRSPLFRTYVRSLNTGSLIQHMYTKQVAEFWLPVPPMDVQRRIVDQANEMFGWLDYATHAALRAERLCDPLERSLLDGAFSGHLVKEAARV